MLKQALKQAAVILLAAVVLGTTVYMIGPAKIEMPAVPPVQEESAPSIEDEAVATISLDEAFERFQKGAVLFIDARHGVDYDAGHIKGAINLILDEADAWLPDFIANTDPQTVIVTYCDGERCHLAPDLAEFLFFNGFEHVFSLKNGWTRWSDREYPVE